MATVLTPDEIKQKIQDWITSLGGKEITLSAIMDYVGVGFAFKDSAPAAAPSSDVPVVYIAGPGTYTGYEDDAVEVPQGSVCIFMYDGSDWSKSVLKIHEPVSVSQNTETGHADINIGEISNPVASIDDIAKVDGGIIPIAPDWTSGEYMSSSGVIQTGAAQWGISAPVALQKGDVIRIKTQGYGQVAIIWLTDAVGSTFNMVQKAVQSDQGLVQYSYTAADDCYVAMSGKIALGDVVVEKQYAQKYALKEALDNAVSVLEEMEYVSTFNILPRLEKTETTTNGIRYSASKGVITINGESESAAVVMIAAQGSLSNWKTGETIHLHLRDNLIDGLYLQILDQVGADSLVSTQTDADFVVPSNPSSLFVRLYIPSGKSFTDVVVCPTISYDYSTHRLGQMIDTKVIGSPDNILLPFDVNTTVQDVSIKAVKGNLVLNGTTSNAGLFNIAGNGTSYPLDKLVAGKKYHVHLSDKPIDGLYIQIMDVNDLSESLYSSQTDGDFVIPANISDLRIRLFLQSGKTFNNISVFPYITEIYTNAQLESRMESVKPTSIPSMLSIIDDDGNPKFLSDLLPVIEAKNVSISSAIYITATDTGTNAMTWEQVLQCYRGGAEILCHTYDHQTTYPDTMTEEEIEHNYTKAKNCILSRGIYGGRYLVYSGETGNLEKSKIAASRVFDLAINSSGDKMNYPLTMDKYNIQRYRLESIYEYDLDALKGLIDDCKNKGGWMVWMIHTSSQGWNSTVLGVIEDCIDYARETGVPIVSVDYAYRKYLKNL